MRLTLLVLIILIMNSGCCSYLTYKHSERIVTHRKALMASNGPAIKAVPLEGGAGVGFDISNWEVLTEQPLVQLGSAIVDAITLYLGNKGIQAVDKGDGGQKQIPVLNINGNNNVINGNNNGFTSSEYHSHTTSRQ